jgi:predicted metal-dependent enzyme (double-stranded beta helix superfamily)
VNDNRNRPVSLTAEAAEIVVELRAAHEDVDAVARTVARLVRDPDRLERALGVDDRCGITVVVSSPQLTVQRIVWPSGIRIPPHDHRMWAVAGTYRGSEDNRLFERDERVLVETGTRRIDAGDVIVLDTDAIHAVANARSTPCVALHVYGGDLDGTPRSTWVPDERSFDPDGMWRAVDRLRAREDDLGRPLTAEETSALLANR